jgi:hypothetical protein
MENSASQATGKIPIAPCRLLGGTRPVRLAYQPPASSTFLSDKKPATSNQPTVLFSQNKSAPAISHQPN